MYFESFIFSIALFISSLFLKENFSTLELLSKIILEFKISPLVVKYIGELRAEVQEKYGISFEKHISELAQIRNQALEKGAWSAAVNAEVARGKAAGLYIEQKIIRTGKLEDLTTEELESRMKQIMEDYSPILEGVEVEELKEKVRQPAIKKTEDPLN